MSAKDVLGKNILVELNIDNVYYPIFCAKTADFTIEQDEIETTNVNSGSSREYVPGMSNALLNMTGITRVNNGDGRVNIAYLMQKSVQRQIWTIRTTLTDNSGNIATQTFQAFIKSTNWNKDVTTVSNSSITWRVTGDVDLGDTIDAPTEPVCEVQTPLYLSTTPGATSVHSDLLNPEPGFTVVVLIVARSNTVYTETTGTPSGTQFKFNSAAGNIEFDTSIPFNDGEIVYVLYEINQP